MGKVLRPSPATAPAPLEEVKQSVHSELQYVSILVDGSTYGGWYRVLSDGQMELLALANMHCERRHENTPIEQARGMLTDFIRVARPKPQANASGTDNPDKALNVPADQDDRGYTTLGDLLYADKAKVRVSEKDWVGLVHAIAAGDQLALRELYDRTHHVVFTLIVRLTNSRESAEDLTLDVFHDVWRRASRYDAAGGSVVGWIMNQARSSALDQLVFERGKKRINLHADNLSAMTPASGADAVSDPREQGRLLRQAVTVLTPEERQAIETAFFSELGYAEVAARTHQPLGTVKTSITSGVRKLRQALTTQVNEL